MTIHRTHVEFNADSLWAGTEASFNEHLRVQAQIEARYANFSGSEAVEEEPQAYLLSEAGKIAVISIKGPLTNNTSAFDKWLGVASYPAIRHALVEAASSDKYDNILLDIDSGGGAVAGVADVADLIRKIDTTHKPVYALSSGGTMASAAYWIGSSAREVYAGRTSVVGSIGVLITHVERSKLLEASGVNVTMVRAGKYKALANQFEALTEDALAGLQDMADSIYKVFLAHVAESRGKPSDYVDQHMAQGRVFLGEHSLHAGLVDGLANFDDLLIDISTGKLDKKSVSFENSAIGAHMKNKKSLTASPALAEAGIDTTDLEARTDPVTADTPVAPAADDATTPASDAPAAPAADVRPTAEDAQGETAMVALLRTQVSERDEQIIQARVASREAEARIAQMEANLASITETAGALAQVVAKSVNTMRVALGGSALDLSARTPAEILADHASASADFTTKFKAGGVAATEPAESTSAAPKHDSLWQARLAATRAS